MQRLLDALFGEGLPVAVGLYVARVGEQPVELLQHADACGDEHETAGLDSNVQECVVLAMLGLVAGVEDGCGGQ